MNEELRGELLRMAEEDRKTREELLYSGQLPKNNYSPVMKRVHEKNNARIKEVIKQFGWTGKNLVGEDGCDAAWIIVQHAVLEPDFQRCCVPLLETAVAAEEVPRWQLAYLKDKVLKMNGEPQLYGMQYVVGENGKSVPYKIHDEANVDARRREAGLPTMEENTKRIYREDELLNKKL
jgi:hypothetical protein